MSCERIEDLLALQRDALFEDAELRDHAGSCAACTEEFELQQEIVRALAPLREVRPLRPLSMNRLRNPRYHFWEKVVMAASLLFCLGLVWAIAFPLPSLERALPATPLIRNQEEKGIVELLEKLGSSSIAEREDAEVALFRVGGKAAPYLKRELREGMDPELRSRIERILRVLPFVEVLGVEAGRAFALAPTGMEKVDGLLIHRETVEKIDLQESSGFLIADEILRVLPWREDYVDTAHQRDLFDLKKKIVEGKFRPTAWLYVRLLGHRHPYVRLHGVLALRELEAKEHAARIAPLVEDGDKYVRREAARALSAFGERTAALLTDPDPDLRRSALLDIERLSGLKARREIEERLADSDQGVRGEAAGVLERLGAKESLVALRKAAETERDKRTRQILDSTIRDLEELQGARKPLEPRAKWHGDKSGIRERSYVLVRSAEEWTALWARHAPNSPAPEVDFRESMVVAIFHGDNSNSSGIALVSATEDDARILIRFRGMWYQSMGEGPSVTDFGIFVIPRSSKTVVLQEAMPNMIGDAVLWKEQARFRSP